MTGYLQRLLDSQAAPLPVRPSQLSRSPLLAADQRLASPEFASNFQFIPPGEDSAPDAPSANVDFTPSPSSSLDLQAEQKTDQPVIKPSGKQRSSGKSGQEDNSALRPKPQRRKIMPGDAQPAKLPRTASHTETARDVKTQMDTKSPDDNAHASRDERQSVKPSHDNPKPDNPLKTTQDTAQPVKPVQSKLSDDTSPAPIVPPVSEPQRNQETSESNAELGQTGQPAQVKPVAAEIAIKAQPTPDSQIVAAHPVHLAPPEIPPAMSPAPDMSEIEAIVSRMVESRLGQNSRAARKSRTPDSAETKAAPQPRPMTAKDASVIGPIEFAPRHTMLFGRRYR